MFMHQIRVRPAEQLNRLEYNMKVLAKQSIAGAMYQYSDPTHHRQLPERLRESEES